MTKEGHMRAVRLLEWKSEPRLVEVATHNPDRAVS